VLTLGYDELLRYTSLERDKWRSWFQQHPTVVDASLQPSDRFNTVGKLIDHIFLVERRHLQRLTGDPLTESTGLSGNNAAPLFDYGASVRRELEQFIAEADDSVGDEMKQVDIRGTIYPMTARKLLFHILLHEIRHWAQIALAVRLAGMPPPGEHDLFYSRAVR
jgi:uncharacterized damage-inducible protein DinB